MDSNISKLAGKRVTPLAVVLAFLSLVEIVTVVGLTQTTGWVQIALLLYTTLFPLFIFAGFFAIWWHNPFALHSPQDFGENTNVLDYARALTMLNAPTVNEADLVKLSLHSPEPTPPAPSPEPTESEEPLSGESDTRETGALTVIPRWSLPRLGPDNRTGHIIFDITNNTGTTVLLFGYRMFRISPDGIKDVYYNTLVCQADDFKHWNTSPVFRLILMDRDEHVYNWGEVDIATTYGLNKPGRWQTEVQIAYLEEGSRQLLVSSGKTQLTVD